MSASPSERHPDETRALVLASRACLAVRGVALWQLSATVERLGSARQALAGDFEPRTEWEAGVRAAVRAARLDGGEEALLAEEMHGWEQSGLKLVSVLDDEYPLNLRFVWDRPPLLWYRGELRPDDAFSVAVVGTRRPSEDGRRRAGKMASLLAARGVTVLSGLAAGIDTEAHTATLEAGSRTVAVLGHGLLRPVYPNENSGLAEAIAERGALVSMFFPTTPPTRSTFPMRNVVTSGMGQGSVVIEATRTSGARLQARLAVEHGKPAFFLRSLVADHEWAREFAAKRGAVIVDDVDDVLPHLRMPDELARVWAAEGEAIREANAAPPAPVARRLAHVLERDQQRLPV